MLVAVCLFLFTFTKTQFVLTPVLLACAWLAVVRRRPGWRVIVVVVVFAAATAFPLTLPLQRDVCGARRIFTACFTAWR